MEQYFKKISQALERTPLSERERLDMRLSLQAFISDHPAQKPWYRRLFRTLDAAPMRSGRSSITRFGMRAGTFALTLVLVAGVGTSYAAEGSLPGSPLYDVKVSVDEPIERATVASSETQTQWDITLANRRLEEAEQLAAQQQLTPQNERIVQTQLDDDTENFNAAVAAAATSTSPSAVVAVSNDQSALEAALSAHAAILATIASSSPAVSGEVQQILAAIQTREVKAADARVAALAAFNTGDVGTSTAVRIAASSEQRSAVSGLSGVRAMARAMGPRAAPTAATFSADASATQETIQDGDTNLAKGKFGQAFAAFQAASLSAQEAQDTAQAQQDLDLPVAPVVVSAVSVSATTTTSAATSSATSTVDTTLHAVTH